MVKSTTSDEEPLQAARPSEPLRSRAQSIPSLHLAPARVVVLRLLAEGAFAPVHRFMSSETSSSVLARQALPDGRAFPAPILLPVVDPQAFPPGTSVALRDLQHRLLAVLQVEEVFPLNSASPATGLPEPAPDERYALSGPLEFAEGLHVAFLPEFHKGRREVQHMLAAATARTVIAVDDPDCLGAASMRQTQWLAKELRATVLFNLFDRETRADDFDRYHRLLAAAQACSAAFPEGSSVLNVVSLPSISTNVAMLLLRAVIHKNYGADAWLLSPFAVNSSDVSWQQLAERCQADYGLRLIALEHPSNRLCRQQEEPQRTPGPPKGLCVWLTGFSGAGKSSIAEQLAFQLIKQGRRVTLLDGDVVRTHLSKGLSFSREDRHVNICRIGYVASEIVYHRGIAVCAVVSPYQASRDAVRRMMPDEAFVEIFVDTPLAVCEARDAKGLYAQARSGSVPAFTGVSDPYEAPPAPEVRIHDQQQSPEQQAEGIMAFLTRGGYLNAG